MSTQTTKRELLDLIGEYWNLAYQEGREGLAQDTDDGAAQRTLSRIEGLVDQLARGTANTGEGITLHLPTDEQAQAVVGALDLYTRMSLGQIEELAYLMRCGEIKPRDDNGADDRWVEDAGAALARVKTLLGHPQSGSFGVGSPKVSASAHRCYEIQKVLSRALAMKRQPRPDFPYVDYDGLIVRYTKDPAPSAHINTNSKKEEAA